MRASLKILIPLFLLLVAFSPTLAYLSFQENIPNGNSIPHPCKANHRWPGLGHMNPMGGGDRHVFGIDFAQAGNQWTKQLCLKDSDGDGLTNGQELGDPDCTWTKGTVPFRVKDLSHPGVCDPYNSELCKTKNTFVSCELKGFEACDSINKPEVKTMEIKFPTVKVPPTETNYYCMIFSLPQDQDYHIMADEAIMDNLNVLHHMIFYGCNDADELQYPSPSPCFMSSGGCSEVLGGWTVGQVGSCYGTNIGVRIGKTAWKRVRLEIHYNNPNRVSTYTDASGFRLYYKPAVPEVRDMFTLMTGQQILTIPPGQKEVVQKGKCSPTCTSLLFTGPVNISYVLNHMHYFGRSMRVELFRNGTKIKDLSNDDYYNYDSPVTHYHNPHVMVAPGDEIRTTCVFNSMSSKNYVYYGIGTADEMCYGFLFGYPKSNLRASSCVSVGPLAACEIRMGTPIGTCDWAKFTNSSHPKTIEMATKLTSNCNLDGFCRPECQELVSTMKDDPCLQGEAATFVKFMMMRNKAGIEWLGRFHSCGLTVELPPPTENSVDCEKECPCGPWNGAAAAAAAAAAVALTTATAAFFVLM